MNKAYMSLRFCAAVSLFVFLLAGMPEHSQSQSIIFLHHSTGYNIWNGGVPEWFVQYNTSNGTNYEIVHQAFPKSSPYGWNNYPYDYWNIWVNNADSVAYKDEPTLQTLTQQYDVIVWKHCFPVGYIYEDTGNPDISSEYKRVENYKLQYNALKAKMREFPQTKFIVWTGAALVQGATTEAYAQRAKVFFDWVRNEWDETGDNIFIWDFYELETEGGLYMKDEYAVSAADSHPNPTFAQTVAPYFCQRIVDVIEGRGDTGSITGTVTGFDDGHLSRTPGRFELAQNYPNPFNPETTIAFRIPSAAQVTLVIYNAAGQEIRTLFRERLTAGEHHVFWDGRNAASQPVGSGVCLYRIRGQILCGEKDDVYQIGDMYCITDFYG